MLNSNFEVKILEHIATLSASGDYSREVNVVSFNGRPPAWMCGYGGRTGAGTRPR